MTQHHTILRPLQTNLVCIGPCIILINKEYNPTRCHLLHYYDYVRLNMFRAPLCPSSGAHDDSVGNHIGRLFSRDCKSSGHLCRKTLRSSVPENPPVICAEKNCETNTDLSNSDTGASSSLVQIKTSNDFF